MKLPLLLVPTLLNFLLNAASFPVVTVEPPGYQNTSAEFDYVGVETFDSFSPGRRYRYQSNFGGLSDVIGTYTNLEIAGRSIFGGAGDGIGTYAVARERESYSIKFSNMGVKGINYFGYWLSALDHGNQLELWHGEKLIYELRPPDIIKLVKGNKDYFGNPTFTPRRNQKEPYVFLNVFCRGCIFDRIVFRQTTSAGYESDNHTVGYYFNMSGIVVPTEEAIPLIPLEEKYLPTKQEDEQNVPLSAVLEYKGADVAKDATSQDQVQERDAVTGANVSEDKVQYSSQLPLDKSQSRANVPKFSVEMEGRADDAQVAPQEDTQNPTDVASEPPIHHKKRITAEMAVGIAAACIVGLGAISLAAFKIVATGAAPAGVSDPPVTQVSGLRSSAAVEEREQVADVSVQYN